MSRLRLFWHRIRQLAGRSAFFPMLVSLRPKRRTRVAHRGSVVVIEGFPRSGNTFAVYAFRAATGIQQGIAHHLHVAGHVRRGVRLGLPTLVLVRPPQPVAASLLTYKPWLPPAQVIEDYITFHRLIWRCRDAIVVATFDMATTDFGSCMEALNERFQTDFTPFQHKREQLEGVFEAIDRRNRERHGGDLVVTKLARPSEHRSSALEHHLCRISAPELKSRLAVAQRWYDLFARHAADTTDVRDVGGV